MMATFLCTRKVFPAIFLFLPFYAFRVRENVYILRNDITEAYHLYRVYSLNCTFWTIALYFPRAFG